MSLENKKIAVFMSEQEYESYKNQKDVISQLLQTLKKRELNVRLIVHFNEKSSFLDYDVHDHKKEEKVFSIILSDDSNVEIAHEIKNILENSYTKDIVLELQKANKKIEILDRIPRWIVNIFKK